MYRRYTDLSNFVEDLWPHLYLVWLNYLRPILIVALTFGSRTSVSVLVLMNQCRCGIIPTNGLTAISGPFMLLTFADVSDWDQASDNGSQKTNTLSLSRVDSCLPKAQSKPEPNSEVSWPTRCWCTRLCRWWSTQTCQEWYLPVFTQIFMLNYFLFHHIQRMFIWLTQK